MGTLSCTLHDALLEALTLLHGVRSLPHGMVPIPNITHWDRVLQSHTNSRAWTPRMSNHDDGCDPVRMLAGRPKG